LLKTPTSEVRAGVNQMLLNALRFVVPTLVGVSILVQNVAAGEKYDPLKSEDASVKSIELTVTDEARSRQIPLRVYLPESKSAAPVVLFSHGLGGTRDGSAFLGKHWAGHGYVVVFLQHPGSDDSVWRSKPLRDRMDAMRKAAGLENFMLRVKDVPAVLDQLEKWNKEDGHDLSGRMDLEHIGMSGHSFGAVTTQAVSGQRFPLANGTITDKRIKAAIAFSPSTPRAGDPKRAFGDVKIPWMLMTGTKDVALVGDQDVESRLKVFPALPPGNKYELVLQNAEHSAFTDRPLPGDKEKRNPNHHRAIMALSTAFWDAYLRDNADAKQWLEGDGAKSVLEPSDKWQQK
jgi:predicted dienelactone hydrolase